jgi:hypothetical protein
MSSPHQSEPHSISHTHEWTLWAVAVACILHPVEEFATGWQAWARTALGIGMPSALFIVANGILALVALRMARVGWRQPTLSLVIPSATLVNAVFFHILPTVTQHQRSPGVYTAALLYVPFSTWALVGAFRDGVGWKPIVAGIAGGTALMLVVFLSARTFVPAG